MSDVEFYKDSSKKSGLSSLCKTCHRKFTKVYQSSNEYKNKRKEYESGDRYKELCRKYDQKNRLNPVYRIKKNLRDRLRSAIKGGYKSGSAIAELGCSLEELTIRFEKMFKPGMSWENYGEWHIDHIKPLSKFDLTIKEQLLLAVNYKNLQPLWAVENLKKHNK
jgi:hypothetical protein